MLICSNTNSFICCLQCLWHHWRGTWPALNNKAIETRGFKWSGINPRRTQHTPLCLKQHCNTFWMHCRVSDCLTFNTNILKRTVNLVHLKNNFLNKLKWPILLISTEKFHFLAAMSVSYEYLNIISHYPSLVIIALQGYTTICTFRQCIIKYPLDSGCYRVARMRFEPVLLRTKQWPRMQISWDKHWW